jgi:RNA polymerase sigma factor (sigma-70 family)
MPSSSTAATGAERHQQAPVSLLSSLLLHYEELLNYLRRRLRAPESAHDVLHDVCVRLLERPAPQAVRQPIALLRRITHDAAIDHCRAERLRQRWVESRAELPEPACPHPGQERRLAAEQELALLVATIRAMPLRRRQVFVMHKIHQVPQAEVAQRMGISLKAVEKHLRLALQTCRQQLQPESLP